MRREEDRTGTGRFGGHGLGRAPGRAERGARELVRCDAPVATLALAENPNGYMPWAAGYQLPASPVPLVKLLAQQSGCFPRGGPGSRACKGTVQ